jgi:S-formylglutathione hydrolase
MQMLFRGFVVGLSVFLVSAAELAAQRSPLAGRVVFDSVSSAALRQNRVGDRGVRSVIVYLPPGYDRQSSRRYPAIYLLHGGRMSDSAWIGRGGNDFYREGNESSRPLSLPAIMDTLILSGVVQPMIIVMPDARDKYDGSWYANSPVIGRFEDFFTHDLIAHIDSAYRTIPTAASRGIAGHSLGAFGAIKLAMTHGDLFGALFALSPCCVAPSGEFAADDASWRATLEMAKAGDPERFRNDQGPLNWAHFTAALAFSPDTSAPPLFVRWPVAITGGQLVLSDSIVQLWRKQTPAAMVRERAATLKALRAIRLENGTNEPLATLRESAHELSDSLRVAGIPHAYGLFEGGHEDHIGERLRLALLPFFSSALAGMVTDISRPDALPSRDDRWRADLRFLSDQLPVRHVNMFRFTTPAAFAREVARLDSAIPQLSDLQIRLRFVRLTSMVRDEHTAASLPQPAVRLPFDALWMDDGPYIVAATASLHELLGARIVAIEGRPMAAIADTPDSYTNLTQTTISLL